MSIVLGALILALLACGAGAVLVLRALKPLRSRKVMAQRTIQALRLRFEKAAEQLSRLQRATAGIEQLTVRCKRLF